MVIFTKWYQMGAFERQVAAVRHGYETIGPKYDEIAATKANMANIFSIIVEKFEMAGSVLDLGCGTGLFGRILRERKPEQQNVLTGVDISEAMLATAAVREHYKAVRVASMQDVIMSIGDFDHIVCSGCIHFLDPTIFSAVLSRMFQTARSSVTLSIEDIPEAYNVHLAERGWAGLYSWNHTQAVRDFGIPEGWRLSYDQRFHAWTSPATGDDVQADILHFERVAAVSNGTENKEIRVNGSANGFATVHLNGHNV